METEVAKEVLQTRCAVHTRGVLVKIGANEG